METFVSTERDSRLIDLVRELPLELKLLIQQEMRLAKAEMVENLNRFKSNLVYLLIGGGIAGVGILLFTLGLGFLAAFGFAALGLPERVADCLGFGLVGLLLGGLGYGFIRNATGHMSKEPLAPQKTIETLKHEQIVAPDAHSRALTPVTSHNRNGHQAHESSEKLVADVNRTQSHMHDTLLEIQRRLRPKYILKTALPNELKSHPLRSSLVGLGTGLAGFFYFYFRRRRKYRA